MSLHGGAAGEVNAAPDPAPSSIDPGHHADATPLSTDWRDPPAQHDDCAFHDRPMIAARGIVIGIIVSIPLWALFAFAAYCSSDPPGRVQLECAQYRARHQ